MSIKTLTAKDASRRFLNLGSMLLNLLDLDMFERYLDVVF